MEESVEAKNELILDWVKKHDLKEDEFWYIVELHIEMAKNCRNNWKRTG